MTKGKLITKARPAKRQHTKPCSDCPFRRNAIPGWLGGNDPKEYAMFAHAETEFHCHVLEGMQCAGAAIFRANICKAVRDHKALSLEPNTVTVFANDAEFIGHHNRELRK